MVDGSLLGQCLGRASLSTVGSFVSLLQQKPRSFKFLESMPVIVLRPKAEVAPRAIYEWVVTVCAAKWKFMAKQQAADKSSRLFFIRILSLLGSCLQK